MANVTDEILTRLGLKFEDLSAAERQTLMGWTEALESNQLTVAGVKSFVHSLKEQIEIELVDEPEFIYFLFFKVLNRKQIYLKARLRNIMLLEAFLSSPDKAKAAIERAMGEIARKREV